MSSAYVLIFTHDNAANWQPTGVARDVVDDALRDMRACMAAYPDYTFEMHVLHPNLYAALSAEKPIAESFF